MSDITLSAGGVTIDLQEDIYWADEHAWSATAQEVDTGLTGAPILHLGLRQYGRPVTLRNHAGDSGWLTRADMAQLQAWADTPGQRMQLDLRGQVFTVVFRHHDSGGKEASPVVYYSDPLPTDYVLATLRFMTVSE